MDAEESAVVVPPDRTLGRALAVGAGIGIGIAALVFVLIAIPFYTLASLEPNGLDRPLVRTGLLYVAGPVGVGAGVVAGALAMRWYRKGNEWVVADRDSRYSR